MAPFRVLLHPSNSKRPINLILKPALRDLDSSGLPWPLWTRGLFILQPFTKTFWGDSYECLQKVLVPGPPRSQGGLERLLSPQSGITAGERFAKNLHAQTISPPILGPSWGHLWAILGPSLGHLGATLGHLGRILDHLGAILGHLGAILGHLGAILSHLGAILGQKGAPEGLDPFWGHFETILE